MRNSARACPPSASSETGTPAANGVSNHSDGRGTISTVYGISGQSTMLKNIVYARGHLGRQAVVERVARAVARHAVLVHNLKVVLPIGPHRRARLEIRRVHLLARRAQRHRGLRVCRVSQLHHPRLGRALHLYQRHAVGGRIKHGLVLVVVRRRRQLNPVHHPVPRLPLRARVSLLVRHVVLRHRVQITRAARETTLDLVVREAQRGVRVGEFAAPPRRQAVVPCATLGVLGARLLARLKIVELPADARAERFGALLHRAEIGVLAVPLHAGALSGRAPVAVRAPLAVVARSVVGRPHGRRGHAALVYAHVRVGTVGRQQARV